MVSVINSRVEQRAQGVMLPVLDRQGGWNCNVSHHTLLRDFEQRVKKSDLRTRSNRGASLTARRREGASVRACYRASVTVWLCQLASQELSQERLRAVTRAINVECAQGFTGYCPDSCLTLHAPLTVV